MNIPHDLISSPVATPALVVFKTLVLVKLILEREEHIDRERKKKKMGNCQAIDAATLVIQHPSGKVDQMYWPVPASEIMKMNPGHYVALLITTTICHTTTTKPENTTTKPENTTKTEKTNKTENTTKSENTTSKTNSKSKNSSQKNSSSKSNKKESDNKNNSTSSGTGTNRNSVRITRVKLLRPTDTLALGHVYRLISTQEVMKGMVAKKQAKMRKHGIELADSEALKEVEKLARKSQLDNTHQVSSRHGHGHRSRTTATPNGAIARPRTWQPSLHSISEATS